MRLHLLLEGHVQGVGFRYSTAQVAAQFPVTGYVRNLPDGNVEIQVEGSAQDVHAFWEALRAHRIYRHVRAAHPLTAPALGRYGSFSIRYD